MGGGEAKGWWERCHWPHLSPESRPWVRKAPSLIHHAPLNPLSLQLSHSGFLFFYFVLDLHPPYCWHSNFTIPLLKEVQRKWTSTGQIVSLTKRWDVEQTEGQTFLCTREIGLEMDCFLNQTISHSKRINRTQNVFSWCHCRVKKKTTQWHNVS